MSPCSTLIASAAAACRHGLRCLAGRVGTPLSVRRPLSTSTPRLEFDSDDGFIRQARRAENSKLIISLCHRLYSQWCGNRKFIFGHWGTRKVGGLLKNYYTPIQIHFFRCFERSLNPIHVIWGPWTKPLGDVRSVHPQNWSHEYISLDFKNCYIPLKSLV